MSVVVIGSGPAGVAAAWAFAECGVRVTILDAGKQIEAGAMDVFNALAGSAPEHWPLPLARRARESFPVSLKHVPLKPAYGSLFPYALDDHDLPVAREHSETLPSLAYGGLSNSWGASILPLRQRDIEDWPISLRDLEPHYQDVLRFLPIAAEHDELSAILPLYTDAPAQLRRGPQAQSLLRHMRRHAPALRNAGFSVGASRLAVVASADDPRGCRHCGLCLHGCPYGSIYNATHTLRELVRNRNVEYRGGVYVDALTEAGDGVIVDFHERARADATRQLTASRVFVACGALSSTRLMLRSTGLTRRARRLHDSQYFVIPMLTPRAAPVSVATQGNTLAQVFLELEDEHVSEHTVHLQIYGYNDVMLSALASRMSLSAERIERAMRPLLGRMVVIQGYLHSADSPGLELECVGKGIRIVGEQDTVGAIRVKRLLRRLTGSARALGMLPVPMLTQIGLPGKGNHLGGSLPMRAEPGELETDTLGRLPGWTRVHVVDASIFPSVPATTVTFSVMANAHRIAAAVARV